MSREWIADEELLEGLARVVDLHRPLADLEQLGDPRLDDGVDQVVLRREVAEQGGRADLGAAGDLRHRHVEALLGEHRHGRVDQALTIAQRVGAGSAGRGGAHVPTD